MTKGFSESFLRKEREDEQRSALVWKIFGSVFLLHTLILGIPLLWTALDRFFSPPKVNAFRVKIGPKALSKAPEVGPPERKRPGAPAIPKEPAVKIPAKPPAEPKVSIPKKPVPKKSVKKTQAKKKTVKKAVKKAVKKPVKKTIAKPVKKKTSPPRRDLQKEVYRPPAGTNELRHSGGSNPNPHVPIGSRDRGQLKGKADHRTPGGGLSEDMEKYNQRAGSYLKMVWNQPPRSLLGSELPAVTIELDIAADGRVSAKRILKPSGIPAMDESVSNLLSKLDRLPIPPQRTCIQFILQTDD